MVGSAAKLRVSNHTRLSLRHFRNIQGVLLLNVPASSARPPPETPAR
jgi:hypothetical protein